MLITALAETEFVNGSLTEGYDVYIAKPVNKNKLEETLSKLALL